MKKTKKIVLALLALAMCAGTLSGCNSKNEEGSSDEKVTLKVLTPYESFDPNTDQSVQRILELTGFSVEYTMLPQKNANEKLMLEMAAGTEYDIIHVNSQQFAQLMDKDVLMPLDDLLDEYGGNILQVGAKSAWDNAKKDGVTYGIPFTPETDEENSDGQNSAYGSLVSAIGVRTDMLEELGLEIPTDTDSLYNVLKAIKDAKGIAPLTGLGGFNDVIASGFDIPQSYWYADGETITPRIKMPQMKEYLEYISKLYKEGLIDPDWATNKQENAFQKFINGQAAMMKKVSFWDVNTLLPALKENNPSADMDYVIQLNGSNGIPMITKTVGDGSYEAIPKTSKHAEEAIKFINARSDYETFVKTYIGEEGVHYEIVDGKYYPLLPAFDELKNSNDFVGVPPKNQNEMWQARARKTPEMAEAYDKMNKNLTPDMLYYDYTSSASSLPEYQQYSLALQQLEDDFYIKSMVSTESVEKQLSDFIASWEAQGGAELERAMNEWYQSFKEENADG